MPADSEIDWDKYVHSPAFDKECREQSRRLASRSNDSGYSSERSKLDSSHHVVLKLKTHIYYFGILPVYRRGKLNQNNLWRTIRSKAVKLLNDRGIQFTSVDLARFCWEEQDADGGSKMVTTPITIWIGVQPDTLTDDVSFDSSNDILKLLETHGISDIDIAYRGSAARLPRGL